MKRKLSLFFCSLLAACGDGSVEETSIERATITTAATCDSSLLAWDDPASTTTACDGPWQYQSYNTCTKRDPECGPLECVERSCDHYAFGTNGTILDPPVDMPAAPGFSVPTLSDPPICWTDPQGRLHCNKPIQYPDYNYANGQCAWYAQQWRMSRVNELRVQKGLLPQQEYLVTVHSAQPTFTGTPGNYYATCTIELHIPVPKHGTSHVDEGNICPESAPCTGLDYPRCTFAGPSCGTSATKYSDPGLTRAELDAAEPALATTPVCTTCDPLPIGTAAEARSKLACIKGNMSISTNRDPELKTKLEQKAMLLLELRGDVLQPSDRAYVRAFYGKTEPTCAPVNVPDVPISCPGDEMSVGGGIEQIERPTSVLPGNLRTGFGMVMFPERFHDALPEGSTADVALPGTYAGGKLPGAELPAGASAEVYFIHMDGSLDPRWRTGGTITFGADILGVILSRQKLDATDATLGSAPKISYPTGMPRALTSDDTIAISEDRRTLTIDAAFGFKQIRVVVAANDGTRPSLMNAAHSCARLALDHVPPEVAYVELPTCLDALRFIDTLPDAGLEEACAGSELRAALLDWTERALERGLGSLANGSSPFAAVDRALFTIDSWLDVASEAELLRSGTSTATRPALGRALGRFWRHAYEGGGTTDDLLNATDLDLALLTSSSRALEVDRRVLNALFTRLDTLPPIEIEGQVVVPMTAVGGLPIDSAEAVGALAGDGLRGLMQRLRDLGLFHDFAHRFGGAVLLETEVSTLWALIAALDDQAALADVVADAGTSSGWRAVFAQIAAEHALLEDALENATMFAGTLLQSILEAKQRRSSYETTGFLDPTRRNTLHASLDQKIRNNVISFVRSAEADLEDEIDEYHDDLATVVNGVIDQAGTEAALDRIANLRAQKFAELDDLQEDLAGLMNSAAAEEARFANIVAAFEGIERAIPGDQYVALPGSSVFELSGADARWTEPLVTIDQISTNSFTNLQPGQILSIRTSGVWSPTCSLRMVDVIDPASGVASPIALTHPETGPEGWTVTYNNGHYESQSHSYTTNDSYSRSHGWKGQICVKAEKSFGERLKIGLSAEACGYFGQDWSHTEVTSDTTSNGTTDQTSAAFSGGLRLPNTPFPDYPAGALLAVVMPVGATNVGNILDVYVVRQGGTAVMIPQAADVHLVVNDLGTCSPLDSINRLTVTAQPMISASALAQAVVVTMGEVLSDLRVQIPALAAQGTVLPSQSSLLRSQAVVDLESRAGIPFQSLPSPLLGLFNAFLDAEMVRLERAVQILSIDRRMNAIMLELQAMDDDVENLGVEARLAQILPSLALRNLDGDRLRTKANRLVDVSLEYLHPIMDLWYPDALIAMNADSSIAAILNATVETRMIDLITDVQEVIEEALLAYQVADLGYQDWEQRPIVAVSFVRPDFVPGPFNPASPWRKADPIRAEALWQAIEADGVGTFTIAMNDVYSAIGGDGVLGCTESVPVIHRMAIFVARPNQTNNQDLNTRGRWLPANAAETDVFVRADGNITYYLDDGLGAGLTVPVIHGEPDEAIELFRSLPRPERLVGLSPFTHFDVNFAVLADLRAQPGNEDGFRQMDPFTGEEIFVATEVMLVMELDSRGVGSLMQGVEICHP